jgi:hypothetical protein
MCCICKIEICKTALCRAKDNAMKHIFGISTAAFCLLNAYAPASAQTADAPQQPVQQAPDTPPQTAAQPPIVKSKPIPKGGTKDKKTGAGSKPTGPAPRQPGTISLERKAGPGGSSAASLLGKTEKMMRSQFGEPRLDVREGAAVKLQYTNDVCVADIYLFPPAEGKEAVVIHLDARDTLGADADRDTCVSALLRRR